MLSKRQHALLVKGIEQLALENVMYQILEKNDYDAGAFISGNVLPFTIL